MFVKYMLNSHVGNFWEATVANITERLGDVGKWSLIIAPILVVVFNFLIYLVSFRENKKDFLNSEENIGDTKSYTH